MDSNELANKYRRGEVEEPSVKSPVVKYVRWNAKDGVFIERHAETKEETRSSKYGILYLDHVFHVSGYSKGRGMGFNSNYVRSTKEEFEVKWKNGQVLFRGFYADGKEKIKASNGHFRCRVFGLKANGELIAIDFKGGVLSDVEGEYMGWFSFLWANKVQMQEMYALVVNEYFTKGENKYPVFDLKLVNDIGFLDKALEAYTGVLKPFLYNRLSKIEKSPQIEEEGGYTEEQMEAMDYEQKREEEVQQEDITDLPF